MTICRQDYAPLEILISDNCSEDETEAVCRQFESADPRIRYVRHQRNIGLYGNHNFCITASRGESVCFYHDDDIYDPRIVSESVAFLGRHPEVGIVCSDWELIDDDGNTFGARDHPVKAITPGLEYIERTIRSGRSSIGLSGAMVRRSALEGIRFFEEGAVGFGDVTLWFRIAEQFDVGHIHKRLFKYRMHRKSFSRTTLLEFTRHYQEALNRFCEEHLRRWPDHTALVRRWRSHTDRYVFWALVYEVGLHVRRRNGESSSRRGVPQTMYEVANYRLSSEEFQQVMAQLDVRKRGLLQRPILAMIHLLLRLRFIRPLAWMTRYVATFRALLGLR